MLIATHNVNGIRAAERRGFAGWRTERSCTVIGLQEVRCPVNQLPMAAFGDYHVAYDPGTLAGRNGVALLTREPVLAVRSWDSHAVSWGPGSTPAPVAPDSSLALARELRQFSAEGRYIEVDLAELPLTIASVYVPKGDSPHAPGDAEPDPAAVARHNRKMAFLAGFARQLDRARRAARSRGREYLVMGDFNIAHTNQDLRNWRSNQNTAGFLPIERDWLTSIISPRTLVDVIRFLHPQTDGPYSWWSWQGQAFDRDTGWRIDYHLATPKLAAKASTGGTDRESDYASRISDHAPVVVDYEV